MEGYYQTTNPNGYALAAHPLPQMNGGYNHTNGGSANHTSENKEAIDNLRKELRSHAEDKPKPYKEDVPKTPIKDEPTENEYITVFIRSQGSTKKAVQIKRTTKLDEFINEVNSSSGLGSRGNSYLVFNETELARGTGKTVEQVGITEKSIVDVCVRTYGG